MIEQVVFVTTELEPLIPGGAGTVVAQLRQDLIERGVKVTVLAVTDLALAAQPGVELVPSGGAGHPFLARSQAAASALAETVATTGVDLVEFLDFNGLAYASLVDRERFGLTNVRIGIRAHGPMDLVLDAIGVAPAGFELIRTLERTALSMADLVIAQTASGARALVERYGIATDRILVGAPPLPSIPKGDWRPAQMAEFVALGRLGEQKGSDLFVATAVRLLEEGVQARFRLLGSDGWSVRANRSMREALDELIPSQFKASILFEDPVARQQLPAALATAWAVVFPSRFETFCLAAHEARQLGLPLVLSRLPEFEEFFSDRTGAILCEVDDLAPQLRRLAADPALRDHLAAAPSPTYPDPLAAYLGTLPAPRHPRAQAGLASAAATQVEQVEHRRGRVRIREKTARRLLRLLPAPAARWAVRGLPQAWKDRFRQLASWPTEAARRESERARARLAARVRSGEFSPLAEPTISVVIPCYNHGPYLEAAIASVFAQRFGSWEVIVVDDGSTDLQTVSLIAGLELPRVRVIRQDNRGLAAARNAGMAVAKGRFLVPLDADDELAPGFMEELLASLETHPDAAFAHCWAELTGDLSGTWAPRPYNPYQMLLSNSVIGCALLRAEAWRGVGGYDETMRSGNEDWDLWLRLQAAGWSQVEVPLPLFRYRKHGISMSVATEAGYEEARRQMPARHPDLYRRAMSLKREWYPWVSVVVGPTSDLAALTAQTLDDLEVVASNLVFAEFAAHCLARGWALREGTGAAAARGKFVVAWDAAVWNDPNALVQLAESLEANPKALGAGPVGATTPLLWRRWALEDPASPHHGVIELPVAVTPVDLGRLERASHHPKVDVRHQSPEEEGRIPAWFPPQG